MTNPQRKASVNADAMEELSPLLRLHESSFDRLKELQECKLVGM